MLFTHKKMGGSFHKMVRKYCFLLYYPYPDPDPDPSNFQDPYPDPDPT